MSIQKIFEFWKIIWNSCKENLDEKKVKKMQRLLKKVETKKADINHSIEILTKIKNGLMDGFIASLPTNKNGMLN